MQPSNRCILDWHQNSLTPAKKSKLHPLTAEQKASNREISKERIFVENVIRKLKIFRILCERYRNRRKRFGLRFNLIAAIYNLELKMTNGLTFARELLLNFYADRFEKRDMILFFLSGLRVLRGAKTFLQ